MKLCNRLRTMSLARRLALFPQFVHKGRTVSEASSWKMSLY
jgi:hypothetical protein